MFCYWELDRLVSSLATETTVYTCTYRSLLFLHINTTVGLVSCHSKLSTTHYYFHKYYKADYSCDTILPTTAVNASSSNYCMLSLKLICFKWN